MEFDTNSANPNHTSHSLNTNRNLIVAGFWALVRTGRILNLDNAGGLLL